MTADSFFEPGEQDWFKPTDHTRGPWHPEHCHAGPPTGLLARAAEGLVPNKQLVRLMINLQRPIPFAGFFVHASPTKNGRHVALTEITLKDADGRICASGETLHIAPQPKSDFPTAKVDVPLPADGRDDAFPISRTLHDLPCFAGDGVQTRYAPDEDPQPGPTTAWIKTVPLLPDESPTPFQRMCPMADCGNAFGRNAEPWDVNFMNADLTIVMHRPPTGEWMGSQAVGHWSGNGIGVADATLLDARGIVGRAVQTVLLRKQQ